jgi:hypothetical protein
MKLGLMIGAIVALSTLAAGEAVAEVDFGAPDFPNYLSRPGAVSCDWIYDNYFRACPTPKEIVVPADDAKGPKKVTKS